MKKVSLTLFMLLLCSVMFASSLLMVPLSSPIYDEMEILYTLEGKNVFITSKPWSEADVTHLLDNIKPSSEASVALKERILSEIVHNRSFTYDVYLKPLLYLQSNGTDFTNPSTMADPYLFDEPIFNAAAGIFYKDNFAAYSNISIGVFSPDLYSYFGQESTSHDNPGSGYWAYMSTKLLEGNWSTNIPFLPGLGDIWSFPTRAYVAVGGNAFRVVAGRDKLSWGNGVLGNVVLGDTMPFHNYASATFTGFNWFNYQLLVDFQYTFEALENTSQRAFGSEGLRFMLGHRFEFSLFKNKVTFAFSDLIEYYSENNYLEPLLFSPMMFLHNLYTPAYSNSLDSLELTYTPFKGLMLYGQLAVDDIAGPGEARVPADNAMPNSYAYSLGAKFNKSIKKDSFLYSNAEFVYTSPFVYHRGEGQTDTAFKNYDYYYLGTIRYFNMAGGNGDMTALIRYMSYSFGSDAIAAEVTLGYKRLGLFDVSTRLMYMEHGFIKALSKANRYSDEGYSTDEVLTTPSSGTNPFDTSESGVPEKRFVVSFDGQYDPFSWLSLTAGLDLVTIWNINNVESANAAFDLQFSLGIKIHCGQ